jgi:hypothetical protein
MLFVSAVGRVEAMEVAARSERDRPPTGVFTILLIGGLVLGVLLLTMLIRSPGSGPRFAVGNAVGTACPPGQGIPVCFDVTVTNTGTLASAVVCEIDAATGNRAAFLSGGTDFTGPILRPGQPVQLSIAVTTETDTVFTPSVRCAPA